METLCITVSTLNHGRGVGARSDTHENSFLSAESRGDTVALQVRFELAIHDVGRQQEGNLAKFRQFLRPAGLAWSLIVTAADAHLGRRIHHHDFIGCVQEAAWNGLRNSFSRDSLHTFAQFIDVLNIHR